MEGASGDDWIACALALPGLGAAEATEADKDRAEQADDVTAAGPPCGGRRRFGQRDVVDDGGDTIEVFASVR